MDNYKASRQAVERLKNIDSKMRKRYPILAYQNSIAVFIALCAGSIFIASSILYFYGYIPMLLCIIINAISVSFLHELEHDTFHRIYFKKSRLARNILLSYCWLFKPNTINPWVRMNIHLHHHQNSGTNEDLEEQLIGNGLPYRLKRFLIMLDPGFTLLIFAKLMKRSKSFKPTLMLFSLFPMYLLFVSIWGLWLITHLANHVNFMTTFSARTIAHLQHHLWLLDTLMVIYIAPAILRVFALQFISSTLHYFGGVRNVFQETQVLTKGRFLPLQLFCCFFGETHAIHHLFINQPFYIRFMAKNSSHQVLRQYGVPFNDLQTFARHNQYPK